MTYVNITALTFPEGADAEIERRFAARKKMVDTAEGFLEFELLRPVVGEKRYFVVTRWDTREKFVFPPIKNAGLPLDFQRFQG